MDKLGVFYRNIVIYLPNNSLLFAIQRDVNITQVLCSKIMVQVAFLFNLCLNKWSVSQSSC